MHNNDNLKISTVPSYIIQAHYYTVWKKGYIFFTVTSSGIFRYLPVPLLACGLGKVLFKNIIERRTP